MPLPEGVTDSVEEKIITSSHVTLAELVFDNKDLVANAHKDRVPLR
jgi:hypothetical protein